MAGLCGVALEDKGFHKVSLIFKFKIVLISAGSPPFFFFLWFLLFPYLTKNPFLVQCRFFQYDADHKRPTPCSPAHFLLITSPLPSCSGAQFWLITCSNLLFTCPLLGYHEPQPPVHLPTSGCSLASAHYSGAHFWLITCPTPHPCSRAHFQLVTCPYSLVQVPTSK